MYSKIESIKTYVPDNIIDNHYFENYLDTSDEWIYTMTGIKQRRFEKDKDLLAMIKACIKGHNLGDLKAVDAIIIASMSNNIKSPSLASLIASDVHEDAFCLDINAACSGFIYGLEVVDKLIMSGSYNKVLFICAEKMSNIIDLNDRNTAILFGDGVTSFIISKDDTQHITQTKFKSISNAEDLIVNDKLLMKGKNVFKFAVSSVIDCLLEVDIKSIDYFVFHQANIRIINTIIKKYNLDKDKVLTNLDKYGNTSSASIGLVLDEYKFKQGDKVMMVGFGAGLSYGSIIYEV